MTEKEKCEKGLLYDAACEELLNERIRCKDLCGEYNQLKNSDREGMDRVMRQIIPSLKEKFLIEPSFWCDYGYNVEMGENFYSNHNLVILDAAKVKFGDNVVVGPNCAFYTAGHPIDAKRRNQDLEYAYPITIGNNVWFGGNVVVLPGVTIGDNCVIGAGSVVTRNIPENSIAVGNPCTVLRTI